MKNAILFVNEYYQQNNEHHTQKNSQDYGNFEPIVEDPVDFLTRDKKLNIEGEIKENNFSWVIQALKNVNQIEMQSLKEEVLKILAAQNEKNRHQIQIVRESHANEIQNLSDNFKQLLSQQQEEHKQQQQYMISEQIAQMYKSGEFQNGYQESKKQTENLRQEFTNVMAMQKQEYNQKIAELKEEYNNKINELRNEIKGRGTNSAISDNQNQQYVLNGQKQMMNASLKEQNNVFIDWNNWNNENGVNSKSKQTDDVQGRNTNSTIADSQNQLYVANNSQQPTNLFHYQQNNSSIDWNNWDGENDVKSEYKNVPNANVSNPWSNDRQNKQQDEQYNFKDWVGDAEDVFDLQQSDNRSSISVIDNKQVDTDYSPSESQEWKELSLPQFLDRAKRGEVSYVLLNLDSVEEHLISVAFQAPLDIHHVIVRAAPSSSKKLYFGSGYDIAISNCSFQGVSIEIRGGEHAVLSDVEFSKKSRRKCLYVSNRKLLELYRVTVLEGDNSGCSFHACDNIKLNNVRITKCLTGIEVAHSKVSMEDCHIGDCGYGVSLQVHSEVVYDRENMFERIEKKPWDKDTTSRYRLKNGGQQLQVQADKVRWNFL
eukprot:TRINITY_DN100273_c0_g1_i7.p1 TRINITY_DN100273_c0_g1~~TRINITY_DN100273_c0_g1_i7.p1  ORF type:complete len:667 (+),score=91.66 TRINITY_DN100273_c0_g1_i7:210-2003(+)